MTLYIRRHYFVPNSVPTPSFVTQQLLLIFSYFTMTIHLNSKDAHFNNCCPFPLIYHDSLTHISLFCPRYNHFPLRHSQFFCAYTQLCSYLIRFFRCNHMSQLIITKDLILYGLIVLISASLHLLDWQIV